MTDDRPITKQALKNRLRPLLRPYWTSNKAKYAGFADGRFGLPSSGQIANLVDSYAPPNPLGELFDCDDFAYDFKAHVGRQVRLGQTPFSEPPAVGIAWGRFFWISSGQLDHACNWILNFNGQFSWFEPQNRTLHPVTECAGRLTLLLS